MNDFAHEHLESDGPSGPAADWNPIFPAPLPLPERIRHSKYREPSGAWKYLSERGELLYATARFDFPAKKDSSKNEKEVLPFTCDENGWRWKAPPVPRPLYGLQLLAQRPEAPVLVVEGEKTADAAGLLLPRFAVITWQGGAGAADKADWRPLVGRSVIVFPDADKPGQSAADTIQLLLLQVGVLSTSVVELPRGLPAGWDLADALPVGLTIDGIKSLIAEAQLNAVDPSMMPEGFRLTSEGVYHDDPGGDVAKSFRICAPLHAVARTHDENGNSWGSLLRWKDANGRRHEWAMPSAMLAGDGREVRALLLDQGLWIAASKKAHDKLTEYLSSVNPNARVKVVSRSGWHTSQDEYVFVLPDGTAISASSDIQLKMQGPRSTALPNLREVGTLLEWQNDVANLAIGNTRLLFALSVALAAPLLHLLSIDGAIFHLRGRSSIGKSTALHVAASTYGTPVQSWRATDNGLEATAAASCDLILCLDEMNEANPEVVGAAAYMLANGRGKQRSDKFGQGLPVAEWRTLVLSSGEGSLSDRLLESRSGPKLATAGQEIRVLDIPAEVGPHGLFDKLHEHRDAAALVAHLKAALKRCFGMAGRAWLSTLTSKRQEVVAMVEEGIEAFERWNVPQQEASGQVRRAARLFGLVAAAGEVAMVFGILPWRVGEAFDAAAACFGAWLENREGGLGAAENATAVTSVRDFIGRHGATRFHEISADGTIKPPVQNLAGWRKWIDGVGWCYLFLQPVFREEVLRGLNAKVATAALHESGFLVGQGSRLARMERVGLPNAVRVYVIRETIVADEQI